MPIQLNVMSCTVDDTADEQWDEFVSRWKAKGADKAAQQLFSAAHGARLAVGELDDNHFVLIKGNKRFVVLVLPVEQSLDGPPPP